ncbi:helix-turn-helix domain-containing protein [Nocardia sp. NPDC055165]
MENSDSEGALLPRAHRAVAAQLRAERARRNMRQTELASMTGIHVSTLSKIEQGKTTMSFDQLFLIAKAFEMEPGDFLNAAQREASRE